jgi:hypothetical protein
MFFDELISFDQAWIEASTKGAVLIFAASEIEERSVKSGMSPAVAGLLGGMGGGVAQAYATMGELSVILNRLSREIHQCSISIN